MPRNSLIICSGFCLLSAVSLHAQKLLRNPTLQQIVGYQLQQVQDWQLKQLPANSVLYQFKSPVLKRDELAIPDEILFQPFNVNPVPIHMPASITPVKEIPFYHISFRNTYTNWVKQSRWYLIKKNSVY